MTAGPARAGLAAAAAALLLAACRAPPRPGPEPAPDTAATVPELAAAVAADARRADRESDAGLRTRLAADAGRAADACLTRAPQEAACLYSRALAEGLEARVHPTRAGELLKTMLANLAAADAADPGYDQAGPARVRALVLLRAPGWPLGPGDSDAALASARRAVDLRPQFPPNLLALAEALAKTGDPAGARADYERARTIAQSLPSSPERDDWLREADQALRRE